MRCRRYSQGLLMTYSVQLPFDRLCLQREVATSGSAVNRRYIRVYNCRTRDGKREIPGPAAMKNEAK